MSNYVGDEVDNNEYFNKMIRLFLFLIMLLPQYEVIAENIYCNNDIKNAVVEKYRAISNYSDEGLLIAGAQEPEVFSTMFSRPNEFKFIFKFARGKSNFDKYILSFDGNEPISVLEGEEDSDRFFEKSIKSMLDGGVGVTTFSSSIIPPLLFGFRTEWSSTLVPTTHEVDKSFEGVACKVIFKYPSGTRKTYWVGKNKLINKVLIEYNSSKGLRIISINYSNIKVE